VLRIAAASDLQFAMPELTQRFEKQSGIRVVVSYGSSGNFFSQIQNGAPFDLFFSADTDYPRKLDAAGLCESGTLYEYAAGKLVLWAPKDSPLDLAKQGWKALLDPRAQKIAIANPAHAPYGRAAVAALKSAGIYDQIQSKLVYGENISQTAQFVQSGNTQAGILALSLAFSPAMRDGQIFEIPSNLYPPLVQGAVVLKSSTAKGGAVAFLDFVRSAAGREVLEKYGFQKAPHD
jgi:molybdate transport system substrate-binding protein